jgi:hypothetical protein
MAVNVNNTNYLIFHAKRKSINFYDKKVVFNTNEIGKLNNPDLSIPIEWIYSNHPDTNLRVNK